jgi:PAS domain S-box-containing protein
MGGFAMNNQKTKPVAVVINDDPTQRGILAGLLNKADVEARAFEGVEAALAAMDPAAPPGLIVTDLYMPGIDGWRFCRLLRSPEYAAFNEIPILVVSATFVGDHPERIAADVGADAFLPSPVDGKAFIAQVRALLSGREARLLPRVLIVEDDKDLAGLLQEAFAAHGYQADTALTVREAEAAFAQTPYDVAVLDYRLPDGTGDALLDAFRAQRPDCVCLMTTGEATPELALSWMKRGAAAYLRKPFAPELLIELCARARRERALLRAEDLLEARTRELRESEERYRAITEALTDYLFTCTVENGEVVKTVHGPGCIALTGYSSKEFAADPYLWFNMVHPEDADRVRSQAARILTGEASETLEHRIRRKNGAWRWVSNTPVPRFDPAGTLIAYDGIISDITERKRAEEELRANEARFRELADAFRSGNDRATKLPSRVSPYNIEILYRTESGLCQYLNLFEVVFLQDEQRLTGDN